ncbi:MAG TPA: ribosome maturation factor RimM [Bacillota bacterium]|nr:ribosome maturation factor RimM [Bacillota bacterium]
MSCSEENASRINACDLIAVGEVLKAQGIHGELKVAPLTDNPRRFAEIRRVYWKQPGGYQELFIERYRLFNQFVLLKFTGIDNMTDAQALGRGLIFIPRVERPRLPEGRYYLDEIEGLRVFTTSGELLGEITEILQTGSNDVYCIKGAGQEILLPALKDVIKTIELEQRKMVVEVPPGLLDDAH